MIIQNHIHLRNLKNKNINKILINKVKLYTIKKYSVQHLPHECCGLITGSIYYDYSDNLIKSNCDVFHPIKNISKKELQWDYLMDPNEYRKVLKTTSIFCSYSSIELTAIFHTHPNNEAIPSKLDIKGAAWYTVYLIYAVRLNKWAAWFWNSYYFTRIPINDEIVTKQIIKYSNNIGK